MSQTSIIAAALIIGYIIFIVMRGEAQQGLAVVGLAPATNTNAGLLNTAGLLTGAASLGIH